MLPIITMLIAPKRILFYPQTTQKLLSNRRHCLLIMQLGRKCVNCYIHIFILILCKSKHKIATRQIISKDFAFIKCDG